MIIRLALPQDLRGINIIAKEQGWDPVLEQMLLDPCYVAIEKEEVVGFIWASVSYSRYLAYIDYLMVKRGKTKIGGKLGQYITDHLIELGVIKIMSLVARSGTSDELKCLRINKQNGFDIVPKTFSCLIREVG